jgi:hypothetical protein
MRGDEYRTGTGFMEVRMRITALVAVVFLFFGLAGVSAWAEDMKMEQFPFYPTLLNTRTGEPVNTSEYEDPNRCKICHRDIYVQWNGSMHSKAFVDPVFQALWRIGEEETDGAIRNLCSGCHTPIGTVGEEVTFNSEKGSIQGSSMRFLSHRVGVNMEGHSHSPAAQRITYYGSRTRQEGTLQGLELSRP